MIFLTFEDICELNRYTTAIYGGRYDTQRMNLCNSTSLHYILQAIQYPIFGIQRHPTLIDKAAALAWCIITRHVFDDGNKRTGMQAAIILLRLNSAITNFDNDSVVEIALAVASGTISFEDFKYYIASRTSF